MPTRNIKREREKRGWSLEYVGGRVGITKQSLSAIENGDTDPSYKVLCSLEKLFNRSHRFLFAQQSAPGGNPALDD